MTLTVGGASAKATGRVAIELAVASLAGLEADRDVELEA
jgi:hypothetical protein